MPRRVNHAPADTCTLGHEPVHHAAPHSGGGGDHNNGGGNSFCGGGRRAAVARYHRPTTGRGAGRRGGRQSGPPGPTERRGGEGGVGSSLLPSLSPSRHAPPSSSLPSSLPPSRRWSRSGLAHRASGPPRSRGERANTPRRAMACSGRPVQRALGWLPRGRGGCRPAAVCRPMSNPEARARARDLTPAGRAELPASCSMSSDNDHSDGWQLLRRCIVTVGKPAAAAAAASGASAATQRRSRLACAAGCGSRTSAAAARRGAATGRFVELLGWRR